MRHEAEQSVTIRGVSALAEALECIGGRHPSGDNKTDHDLAKVIVENKISLRELVGYALKCLAQGD
jgi:hypothetical protein